MKHTTPFQYGVKLFSGVIFLSYAGCVLPAYTGILRNTSALPVMVLIEHGAPVWADGFEIKNNKLPYSSKLLSIKSADYGKMKDSLQVTITAAAVEFSLPAHSTVRLGHFRNGSAALRRLTLRRENSPEEVLDSMAIARRVQVKNYTVGLDI